MNAGVMRESDDEMIAPSATGAVFAKPFSRTPFWIYLDASKLGGHDEDSLAEEVEQIFVEVKEAIYERISAIANTQNAKGFTPTSDIDRIDKYRSEIENLSGEGTSSSELVQVIITADTDPFIRINRNALRRTDISAKTLEKEINEAFVFAVTNLSAQKRQLKRSIVK